MNKELKIKTIPQLLEFVETIEKATELVDYINNLQKENEKLNIILQGLVNQKYEEKCKKAKIVHIDYVTKEKLQERINKALEELYYLESNCDINEFATIKLRQILEGVE